MRKFVALGVGQGDAFYLDRNEASILFDGGRSKKKFIETFQNSLNKTHVDIIVCSHNDADHTNGLIGYLESDFTYNEIWLPASWLGRIDTLLSNPNIFFEELLICTQEKHYKIYLDEISSDDFNNTENRLNLDNLIKDIALKLNFSIFKNTNLNLSRKSYNMLKSLYNTANKIRELVILAYKSGKVVRWFQYSHSTKASGGETYFIPVNCFEIKQLYTKKIDVLKYLYLTKANKESLVFYSPKTKNAVNGILYSADSNYSFTQTIPLNLGNNPIITVPHHGAKSNESAYQTIHLKNYLHNKNTILVRSDCKSKNRPGKKYKLLKSIKYCTICNHHNTLKKEDIILKARNGKWTTMNQICSCK